MQETRGTVYEFVHGWGPVGLASIGADWDQACRRSRRRLASWPASIGPIRTGPAGKRGHRRLAGRPLSDCGGDN